MSEKTIAEENGKEKDNSSIKLLKLAEEAERNGELEDALVYYDKILSRDNQDVSTWIRKGRLSMRMEQFDNSINFFDQALNIDPESFDAVLEKARALESKGEYEEALLQFQRSIRLGVTDPRPYFLRGKLLRGLDRVKEALESIEQSLRNDPEQAAAWREKALCHENLREYRKALVAYDRSVSIEGKSYEVLMERGKLLAVLSEHGKALADFRRAKELEEATSEAYYRTALIMDLENSKKEARNELEEALMIARRDRESDESAARIHFQLALLHESGGEKLLAFQHVSEARNLVSSDPAYQNYHRLLGSEYHGDLADSLVVSLLRELEEEDVRRVAAALSGLLDKGDRRTIKPVVATLYDPDIIRRRLTALAASDTQTLYSEGLQAMTSRTGTGTLSPWETDAAIGKELERLKARYPHTGDDGSMAAKIGQVLLSIGEGLGGKDKALIGGFQELGQLMEMNPLPDLFPLLLLLIVRTGSNYSLLLGYTKQPHLLNIEKNAEHVKRSIFGKYRMGTAEFNQAVREAFENDRNKLIEETISEVEKGSVGSITRSIKPDTWITYEGGD